MASWGCQAAGRRRSMAVCRAGCRRVVDLCVQPQGGSRQAGACRRRSAHRPVCYPCAFLSSAAVRGGFACCLRCPHGPQQPSLPCFALLQAAIDDPSLYSGVQVINISLRMLHISKQAPWQRPLVKALQVRLGRLAALAPPSIAGVLSRSACYKGGPRLPPGAACTGAAAVAALPAAPAGLLAWGGRAAARPCSCAQDTLRTTALGPWFFGQIATTKVRRR